MLSPGLQEEFSDMNFVLMISAVMTVFSYFQKAEVLGNKKMTVKGGEGNYMVWSVFGVNLPEGVVAQ